jgi:hypothetical protein
MSNRQRWGYGSFGVGLVLAIAFFVASAASSGAGTKSGFLAAAMVCVVAAFNGLAVGISDRISAGRLTGLVVGVIGFVAWGVAWIADQCSAGDASTCSALNSAFGWAAVFSAIAALASLFPNLFRALSAQRS